MLSVGVEVYPWVEVYYLCRGDIVGWRCIVVGGVLGWGTHHSLFDQVETSLNLLISFSKDSS